MKNSHILGFSDRKLFLGLINSTTDCHECDCEIPTSFVIEISSESTGNIIRITGDKNMKFQECEI